MKNPTARTFTLLVVMGSLAALTACSSSDSNAEETASVRQAICSGGGGGGDTCISNGGFCPPECSTCFQSVGERVRLQNVWSCRDPNDPNAGGGSSAESGGRCVAFGATCSASKRCCRGLVCGFEGERDDTWCHRPN